MFLFTRGLKYVIIIMIYFKKDMIYTNRFINSLSLVLTIIVFIILNVTLFKNPKTLNQENLIFISNIKKTEKKEEKNSVDNNSIELGNWYIEIPKINLKAPISEGTSTEILNTKVGHFEETAIEFGNVGLAGHNRGYEFNFFENLKKLKKDDEIIYTHESFVKKYKVDKIEIIKNNDWSYLDKSEDNKITLITCVENQPEYRRCVQAIEILD